jgi:hypothetical protein
MAGMALYAVDGGVLRSMTISITGDHSARYFSTFSLILLKFCT